jgi:hypothetical protein
MFQNSEKAFERYAKRILLAKGWKRCSINDWDWERAR